MSYNPQNPNGQATSANSAPVVIASDQSAVPVSGTISVSGGATAAKQDTGNTSLASIDGKITTVNTGAVVVSSSALPSGAATAAKQPALGTAGTASADVLTVQGIASMTALKVDGSAVTQPISAASLPLPTLAATSTKQSDGSQKTQVVDGSGNVIGSTSNALDVNIKSGSSTNTQYAEGATAATATGTLAMGKSGTTLKATQTDASGNLRVDLSQTSANATAIKVDGSAVTQPVSGTVTANAGTNLNTSALALDATLTGGTQKSKLVDSGGTNVATVSAGGALKVDGSAVTQPVSGTVTITPSGTQTVSGTVTANIGTSGSLALDTSVNGILVAQNSTTSGQSGPLAQGAVTTSAPSYTTAKTSPLSLTTAGALRVDNSANTQPVSGTVSITANSAVNVAQINGVTTQTGTGTAGTGTQRVAVASDSAINAVQSGTWTVQPGNTANTTAWKVDGSAVTQPVSLASVPSHPVTNAGTFAVQDGADKAEDAAAVSGDTGAFVLGVRNDALADTTNTNGDYTQFTVGSSGRLVIQPHAPGGSSQITGNQSATASGEMTAIISHSGSLVLYITAVQVANTGSSTTLITFKNGTGGTTLAYTIAPAGGGSNINFDIPLKVTNPNDFIASVGTASTTVYVSAQGYYAAT